MEVRKKLIGLDLILFVTLLVFERQNVKRISLIVESKIRNIQSVSNYMYKYYTMSKNVEVKNIKAM